jgi:hypothetical protein
MSTPDELLTFLDDLPAAGSTAATPDAWRVLVVDDDPDVHESTRYALR